MRLNKILAGAGVSSRRGAEEMLAVGRVAVNGRTVTEPGAQADPAHDVITVDGRPLPAPPRYLYIMLNKPPGVVTTARDPQGRPTALALVQRPERLFHVGRLDRDTEGLLLLTNDGAWANHVGHPSGGVEKEYEALVEGVPDASALRRLAEGVVLPDGHVARGQARTLEILDGRARVSLTLHEGHKRQARLMFGALGYPVRALRRVRIGGLHIGGLEVGAWRELTLAEVASVTAAQATAPGRQTREYAGERQGTEQRRSGHVAVGKRDAGRGRDAGGERDAGDDRAAGNRGGRPGRVGEVHDKSRRGRRIGPAVPGYGRDVPRSDVAGLTKGARPDR